MTEMTQTTVAMKDKMTNRYRRQTNDKKKTEMTQTAVAMIDKKTNRHKGKMTKRGQK